VKIIYPEVQKSSLVLSSKSDESMSLFANKQISFTSSEKRSSSVMVIAKKIKKVKSYNCLFEGPIP
jgi:hypothetical protein